MNLCLEDRLLLERVHSRKRYTIWLSLRGHSTVVVVNLWDRFVQDEGERIGALRGIWHRNKYERRSEGKPIMYSLDVA